MYLAFCLLTCNIQSIIPYSYVPNSSPHPMFSSAQVHVSNFSHSNRLIKVWQTLDYDAQILSQLLCTDDFELEETNLEIPDFSIIDTEKKTLSDIRLFKSYLVNTGENTEIENMTAENLNKKFSTFLLSVTKKMGQHMNLPHSEDSCVVWVVIIVREIKS